MRTAGTRPLAAFLAAVVFGILAAGCGGGSKATTTTTAPATTTKTTVSPPTAHPGGKAAYVAKMRAIGRALGESLNGVESAQSVKQAAGAYRKVQAELRRAQKQIEAITPPAAIQKEHTALAKAVGEFADELGPIVTKIAAGDITASTEVPKLHGYLALRAAAAAITKAGYKIGT